MVAHIDFIKKGQIYKLAPLSGVRIRPNNNVCTFVLTGGNLQSIEQSKIQIEINIHVNTYRNPMIPLLIGSFEWFLLSCLLHLIS